MIAIINVKPAAVLGTHSVFSLSVNRHISRSTGRGIRAKTLSHVTADMGMKIEVRRLLGQDSKEVACRVCVSW